MSLSSPDDVIALHEEHMDRNTIAIDLFSGRNSHAGCGECCSRVLPTTPTEVSALVQACRDANITFEAEPLGVIDMRCPILDKQSMLCLAYESRPMICEVFRCDDIDGNMTAYASISPLAKDHDMRHELKEFERNVCDIACIATKTGAPDIHEVAPHLRGCENADDAMVSEISNQNCFFGTLDDGDNVFIALSPKAKEKFGDTIPTEMQNLIEEMFGRKNRTYQETMCDMRIETYDLRDNETSS